MEKIDLGKKEAISEAGRIREIRHGGDALVIGSDLLAKHLGRMGFHAESAPDFQKAPGGKYDAIALPYPCLDPKNLSGALTEAYGGLRLGGFLRVVLFNRERCESCDPSRLPALALSMQELIAMLTDAGFKSVVIDHRLFWREAMMAAGKRSPWLYAPWAWLRSRRAKGCILAATAWK